MSDHYDRYNGMDKHGKNLAELGTDCISRQAAIDRINKQREHLQPDIYPQDQIGDAAYRICAEFIGRLPSAQPKRGKWHYSDGKPARIGLSFGVICDQCGTESEYCTNFCGECGADMRQKGENHESN